MGYKFTKSDDEYIIKNYSSMTYKDIAKALLLTESQVRHRVQRHLKIKPTKRRKHFHDVSFFENDSKEKFYVLGLISSDGNLFNNSKVSISLHSKDVETLIMINKKICPTNLISTRKNCNMSELVIYNKEIYSIVKSYGITERKSLTLTFPKQIPRMYLRDYIAGYFDGDGSLSISDSGKRYKKLTIQFLGTFDFLNELSIVLDNELHVGVKNISKTNSKIYCLRYFTKQARCVLEWIYSDTSFRLSRKQDKFLNYMIKFRD